jgi:hypothetical protein
VLTWQQMQGQILRQIKLDINSIKTHSALVRCLLGAVGNYFVFKQID